MKHRVWRALTIGGGGVLLITGCSQPVTQESPAAGPFSDAPTSATATATPAENNEPQTLRFYGLRCGDLDATHQRDTKYEAGSVWDPTAGLGPDDRHDDRYYTVECGPGDDASPNTEFAQRFENGGVSIKTALSEVALFTLPSDAHLVWGKSFPTCYAADYESPTLTALKIGGGQVTFELGSSDAANNLAGNYETTQITEATFTPLVSKTPAGYEC